MNDSEVLLYREEDKVQDEVQNEVRGKGIPSSASITPKEGKRQSRRKPCRTKKDKARSTSQTKQTEDQDQDQDQDRVDDLGIPALSLEPKEEDAAIIANEFARAEKHKVVEYSTQIDNPTTTDLDSGVETKGAHDAEVEDDIATNKTFKTNAAGLALLKSLAKSSTKEDQSIVASATSPPSTPALIDDGVNSLEVNPSETPVFADNDLVEQNQGPAPVPDYGYGYRYDASIPASINADMNSTDNINPQEDEGSAPASGYYQPQQQWTMAPQSVTTDGPQEYYPNPYMIMQQSPMIIPMQPYGGESTMAQTYTMTYGSMPYPVYGYPQVVNAPMQQQVRSPLKYEQVNVGGTVFFNPVYETPKDTQNTEDGPMEERATKEGNITSSLDDTEKNASEEKHEKGKRGKNGKYGKKTKYLKKNKKNNTEHQKRHDTSVAIDSAR